jgi:hypothetical protein
VLPHRPRGLTHVARHAPGLVAASGKVNETGLTEMNRRNDEMLAKLTHEARNPPRTSRPIEVAGAASIGRGATASRIRRFHAWRSHWGSERRLECR